MSEIRVPKIPKDNDCQEIYGKLMSLTALGSGFTNGEFRRLNSRNRWAQLEPAIHRYEAAANDLF